MAFGDLVQIRTFDTAASPANLSFNSDVTAGNLLVVRFTSDHPTTAVTDTRGNTYAEVTGVGGRELWYAIANSTGACTVTVTANGGTTNILSRSNAEYAGPFSTVPLIDDASANGVGTTADSGNVTADRANSLFLSYHTADVDLTEAGGWTVDDDQQTDTNLFTLSSHLVASGTDSATTTLTSAAWVSLAAVFRPAVGAFTADSGSYTVTGTAVAFPKTSVLMANSGTYEITGASAALVTALRNPTLRLTAVWPIYDYRLEVYTL